MPTLLVATALARKFGVSRRATASQLPRNVSTSHGVSQRERESAARQRSELAQLDRRSFGASDIMGRRCKTLERRSVIFGDERNPPTATSTITIFNIR
jgi:hypothetical protein